MNHSIAVKESCHHCALPCACVKSLPRASISGSYPLSILNFGLWIECVDGALVACDDSLQKGDSFFFKSGQVLLCKSHSEGLLVITQDLRNEFGTDMSQLQVTPQNPLNSGSGHSGRSRKVPHRLPAVLLKLGLHFGNVASGSASAGSAWAWFVFRGSVQVTSSELLVL